MTWLVFAWETYYPDGGWLDFWSSHETRDDAEAAAAAARAYVEPVVTLNDGRPSHPENWPEYDHVQIVDVDQRKVVRFWTLDRIATSNPIEPRDPTYTFRWNEDE